MVGKVKKGDVRDAMKELREAAFLSVLEDIQDVSLSTKDELMSACYLLEEHGQDEEAAEEIEYFAQTLYREIINRAHELDSEEVQAASAIF